MFTVLTLAGCGAEASSPPPAGVAGEPVEARSREQVEARARPSGACEPGAYRRLRTSTSTPAAVVVRPTGTSREPGGRATARFGLRNVNGARTVFGVLGARVRRDCSAAWYRVQLPLKPNGATGYVRARDVWVGRVRTRIEVDLSERRVTLFRDGRELLSAAAAIGTSATPTPTGTYYVNQRLIPEDESGPFGPGAIGISAFSEVLTGWAQGGPIAIHGTNQPWTIGEAASNGCLRVRNDVLERMFDATLAGTPVVIRS